jgi:predicted nuclease with TOPRIM domain
VSDEQAARAARPAEAELAEAREAIRGLQETLAEAMQGRDEAQKRAAGLEAEVKLEVALRLAQDKDVGVLRARLEEQQGKHEEELKKAEQRWAKVNGELTQERTTSADLQRRLTVAQAEVVSQRGLSRLSDIEQMESDIRAISLKAMTTRAKKAEGQLAVIGKALGQGGRPWWSLLRAWPAPLRPGLVRRR